MSSARQQYRWMGMTPALLGSLAGVVLVGVPIAIVFAITIKIFG